jgi:hypothetical protein
MMNQKLSILTDCDSARQNGSHKSKLVKTPHANIGTISKPSIAQSRSKKNFLLP